MDFLTAVHSDTGLYKQINQDALMVKVADTRIGKVCMGVVCDGMGGLSYGELASASVIRAFDVWFERQLPQLIEDIFGADKMAEGGSCQFGRKEFDSVDKFKASVRHDWMNIVTLQNEKLLRYAAGKGGRMGTTAVILLVALKRYFLLNIGDSRAYMLTKQLKLLTKDQTVVQFQLDAGIITEQEACAHPQSHVLLQCIGATDEAQPDFFSESLESETLFLLCSDGFRHQVSEYEMFEHCQPKCLVSEQMMKDRAVYLTELNKQRDEQDNISVILIKAF